jgi:CheY-like chemotaxis protein
MSTPVKARSFYIYMADDDVEDIQLAREAIKHHELPVELIYVHDGQDLLDLLRSTGKYAGNKNHPPHLVLLDLNMPRKDGRETLKELKADARLKMIPVIIYSTSSAPEDINNAYSLGANSYITKPFSFEELAATLSTLVNYWMKCARLPGE